MLRAVEPVRFKATEPVRSEAVKQHRRARKLLSSERLRSGVVTQRAGTLQAVEKKRCALARASLLAHGSSEAVRQRVPEAIPEAVREAIPEAVGKLFGKLLGKLFRKLLGKLFGKLLGSEPSHLRTVRQRAVALWKC